MFDISGDSTPGPDGFPATFFQSCWPCVSPDVVEAVREVFAGAYLPRSFTATSVVLLPKKKSPETWADFRPISLCNVTNKIITKIITSRLTPLLPLAISPNQSGFVKGRLLHDNVLLAQEMFHELGRSYPSPNVALKLDMAKAYDRVQWPFLFKVLRQMGFPPIWINLIERCIGSCWFSILINGVPLVSSNRPVDSDKGIPSPLPCSSSLQSIFQNRSTTSFLGKRSWHSNPREDVRKLATLPMLTISLFLLRPMRTQCGVSDRVSTTRSSLGAADQL